MDGDFGLCPTLAAPFNWLWSVLGGRERVQFLLTHNLSQTRRLGKLFPIAASTSPMNIISTVSVQRKCGQYIPVSIFEYRKGSAYPVDLTRVSLYMNRQELIVSKAAAVNSVTIARQLYRSITVQTGFSFQRVRLQKLPLAPTRSLAFLRDSAHSLLRPSPSQLQDRCVGMRRMGGGDGDAISSTLPVPPLCRRDS